MTDKTLQDRLRDGLQIGAAAEAADALDAQAERIKALDGELLAARAEAALQHNWNCEHDGGCALTDESGYRPQALKYVEDYHALKARIKALEGALIPDGWKLVPREATIGMCEAAYGGAFDTVKQLDWFKAQWRDYLEAVPEVSNARALLGEK